MNNLPIISNIYRAPQSKYIIIVNYRILNPIHQQLKSIFTKKQIGYTYNLSKFLLIDLNTINYIIIGSIDSKYCKVHLYTIDLNQFPKFRRLLLSIWFTMQLDTIYITTIYLNEFVEDSNNIKIIKSLGGHKQTAKYVDNIMDYPEEIIPIKNLGATCYLASCFHILFNTY